ncbi:MAG: hypothetical protein RJA36_3592 [Pseudomonadota bacterium]|jgi:hypothetical protein
MAYTDANLLRGVDLGYNCSLWLYDTLDAAATVDTSAYFTGEALKKLRKGDIILRRTWGTTIYTGTVSTVGLHVVLTNDGTTANVTDALALTMTDTD